MLIKDIQRRVCKAFKVTRVEMLSESRVSRYILPRHLAMYICYCQGHSTKKIAHHFNRKNHTTVLNAIKKIKYLLQG